MEELINCSNYLLLIINNRRAAADTASGRAPERARGVGLLHADMRRALTHARPANHAPRSEAG